MNLIKYNGSLYPELQSTGNASKFAIPFAQQIISGFVYDVGYGCEEWKFPNSVGVDEIDNNGFHAMNLPPAIADAIYSSHFLEHYKGRFQDVIEYWITKIKDGGHIFLYLPNCEYQKYWAWGNKKHIHYLTPKIMKEFCENSNLFTNFIVTDGYDLNGSFYCVIEK